MMEYEIYDKIKYSHIAETNDIILKYSEMIRR